MLANLKIRSTLWFPYSVQQSWWAYILQVDIPHQLPAGSTNNNMCHTVGLKHSISQKQQMKWWQQHLRHVMIPAGDRHPQSSSPENENLLNIYSPSGHTRWVCFLIRTDLEKLSIASLAHQWILCSEWVPSESPNSWLKHHSNPHHSSTSNNIVWREIFMFVINTSIITAFELVASS